MLPYQSQDAMHPDVELPVLHAIGSICLSVEHSIAAETSVVSRCTFKAEHGLLPVFKPV